MTRVASQFQILLSGELQEHTPQFISEDGVLGVKPKIRLQLNYLDPKMVTLNILLGATPMTWDSVFRDLSNPDFMDLVLLTGQKSKPDLYNLNKSKKTVQRRELYYNDFGCLLRRIVHNNNGVLPRDPE